MPSIFNNNLFDDDWFGFPFYGYADKAENRAEKKLYGHHANNTFGTLSGEPFFSFPFLCSICTIARIISTVNR